MEIGEKKYRLTLIEKKDKFTPVKRNPNWKQVRRIGIFKCDCGNIIEVEVNSVDGKRGNTRSCGCLGVEQRLKANTTHGRSRRDSEHYQTYSSWQHMKDRCLNPKNKYYKNYGERGITICDRWMDFERFLEDMGDRSKELSLDRIDNNKGYYKENCRWATRLQQANNTRRNKN